MRWMIWIGLVMLSAPALGHDAQMRQSMYADWMNELHSKKGLCCTQNEGSTVKDVDWSVSDGMTCVQTPIEAAHPENAPGRYCVRLEGTWWYVPDNAVITESNKYGLAVVWPIWESRQGGPKTVAGFRCFMPGAMG